MQKLINQVKSLQKSDIKNIIDKRILEFKAIPSKNENIIFDELCFCLLTANYNAQRAIQIQKDIGAGFRKYSEPELAKQLKVLGHRFPNMRAKFIVEARKHKKDLIKLLKKNVDDTSVRLWLADNVKGLGYKESSHFLRNIGRDNCAIIDFHIIDILVDNKIIKPYKTLSKSAYLEIENVLYILAEKLNLTLAELDLYLWYLETGKILK